MGDILDEFKTYGFSGGIESMREMKGISAKNGHDWLTEDLNY